MAIDPDILKLIQLAGATLEGKTGVEADYILTMADHMLKVEWRVSIAAALLRDCLLRRGLI